MIVSPALGTTAPHGSLRFVTKYVCRPEDHASPSRIRIASHQSPHANKTRNKVQSTEKKQGRFVSVHLGRLSRQAQPGTAPGGRAWRRRRRGPASPRPLLVIAGAGSGKTNTLAHRVAHLIVNGADPRRILLMTFSRRAAAEMARRVERIAAQVLGQSAGVMTDALTWAGTFHGIGARLLRDYADEIGLDPAFTIHDREDSADLMNLVRHELGFSKTESRFPDQGHLPCDLFALRQRRAAARRGAARRLSLVRRLGGGAARAVRGLCRGQAAPERSRLRRPAALLGADGGRARARRRTSAGASTMCWSTNTRTPTGCRPRSCWR